MSAMSRGQLPQWAASERTLCVAGALLFLLSAALLLWRALAVERPIFLADEYYYLKTAQLWHLGLQTSRDVIPLPERPGAQFPNVLFFALYQHLLAFADRAHMAAQIANAALAVAMAALVQRVAVRGAGLPPTWGWGLAILTLWLPATTYLGYFLPEALHDVLVWLGVAACAELVRTRPIAAAACFGAALGAAFLAKPNALALLAVGSLTTLAVARWHVQHGQRARVATAAVVAQALAFLATAFLLNRVCAGNWVWHPFGEFYAHSLVGVGAVSDDASQVEALARYVGLYFGVLAVFCGVPLAILAATWRPGRDPARDTLAVMAMIGLPLLALASAKVGANWEHVYVNHVGAYATRYMQVLYPLAFIAALDCVREHPPMPGLRRRIVVGSFTFAGLAFLFLSHGIDSTIQLRELHWVTHAGHPGAPFAAVGGGFLLALWYWALVRRIRLYVLVLAVDAALSCVAWMRIDHAETTHGTHAWVAKDAQEVARRLVPAQWDRGLVVGKARGFAPIFMASFPGFVPALAGAPWNELRDAVPAGTTWIVFERREPPGFDRPCVQLKLSAFCDLSDGGAR
jgi:hypothetical protein